MLYPVYGKVYGDVEYGEQAVYQPDTKIAGARDGRGRYVFGNGLRKYRRGPNPPEVGKRMDPIISGLVVLLYT